MEAARRLRRKEADAALAAGEAGAEGAEAEDMELSAPEASEEDAAGEASDQEVARGLGQPEPEQGFEMSEVASQPGFACRGLPRPPAAPLPLPYFPVPLSRVGSLETSLSLLHEKAYV